MMPVLAGAVLALALGVFGPAPGATLPQSVAAAAPSTEPGPVDPVDPVEPVDPVDPVDPSDPVDPVDPGCCAAATLTLDPAEAPVGETVNARITCPYSSSRRSAVDMSSTNVTMRPSGTLISVTGSVQVESNELILEGSFTVPDVEPREYSLSTECGGRAQFTVTEVPSDPILTVSPDHGAPGAKVVFHGTNLPRCTQSWSVTLDGAVLGNVTQDGDTFDQPTTVPAKAVPGGQLARIECASPEASAQADFEVESGPSTSTGPGPGPGPGNKTTTTTKKVSSTTTTDQPITATDEKVAPDSEGDPQFAPIAVAGLTSVAAAVGAGFMARARRARRWLNEHVDTQPRPAPPAVAVDPPPGQVRGRSVRLEPRGDAGHQITEENGRDQN